MKICSLVTYLMGLPFSQTLKKNGIRSYHSGFVSQGRIGGCYNACFQDVHCVFPSNVMDKMHMAPPPTTEQVPKHF